jgi:anti-sigma-K factor RskA
MIDERQQELASLYVVDLLEGDEHAAFEAALTSDPELQALVIELKETSAALVHIAPPLHPPLGLKQRVLTSVGSSTKPVKSASDIARPSFRQSTLISWAIAACLVVCAGWLVNRNRAIQSEATALQNQNASVNTALANARRQIEVERAATQQLRGEMQQQLASLNSQLVDARAQLTERVRLLEEARNQLAGHVRRLEERDRQLAEAQTQLANRGSELANLKQRIEVLTNASVELDGQLGKARQQVAQLTSEIKSQSELAELKITTLVSMLKNSPEALAVAVWDPKLQQGVLNVEHLPALAAHEDYQLWVVDPQYPNPVDGGVFTVEPRGGKARFQFKTNQPIQTVNAFAVTRERKGGVPKAQGPFVLLGK